VNFAQAFKGPKWGGLRRLLGQSPARDAVLAFLAYALLTVAVTWPLPAQLSTAATNNPDTHVNFWSLAWVARQLFQDPAHLFDANAYYPHTLSLAYAESLIPQSLQAAPLLWLGFSPIFAHNLPLLLTFPLAGLGLYLLARDLGASRSGAFLGGLGYAFCIYRYEHLIHIQSVSAQWFPFAVLSLRLALRSRARRHLASLALFSVLQALSSGYYAVLLAPTLLVTLLFGLRRGWRAGTLPRVVLTLTLSAGVVSAVLWPHREVQQRHHLVRSRAEAVHWSARWASYADPGTLLAWPHLRKLHQLANDPEHLYPGLAILLFGAVGAASARRSAEARFALGLAATGVLLSLGPEIQLGPLVVPGPLELARSLPGVSGLRTPVRLAVLAFLGSGLLAALGWSHLTRRLSIPRGAVVVVLVAAALEAYPARLARIIQPVPAPPPSASWLASAPHGPVLELPWKEYEDSAIYLYWSTEHWQPMVNGYGAFEPPGNRQLGLIGARFPRPYAARRVRDFGIRYVVIHTDRLRERQRERLRSQDRLPAGVRLAAVIAGDWIYELSRPSDQAPRD